MQNDIVKALRNGQTADVFINDIQVAKGFVDTIRISEKVGEKTIMISGRDYTADLVDCSFIETPNEWKKQTLLKIVSDLCAPFAIDVAAAGSASSAASVQIETFKATEGMSICNLISQLCVDNMIMPISLGDGKLTLIRAEDAERLPKGIVNPGNIFALDFYASDVDRFSKYMTKGQGIETPEKDFAAFLHPFGSFSDSVTSRYRPKMLFPENPSSASICMARSKWEAKYQAGKSRQFSYMMIGWLQENKKPWPIHSLVSVDDKSLNYSGELYCSDVLYERDGSRDMTTITLVQQSTFTADGKIEKMVVD
jgi:prophage tail gpP-like protein